MNRIRRLEDEIIKLKDEVGKKGKKKQWKPSFKLKGLFKKSKKKADQVLVLYLTQKYEARFSLQRIISGNLVVLRNKVHVLNPKKMFIYGKNRFYIIREIDRQPVSNEDYDDVRARNDDTDEDVPLIKAVLGAIQKEKKEIKSKNIIIAIILIAVAVGVMYFIFSGGSPPPV